MAQPASVINTRGQSTDSIYGTDGVGRVKLAVGEVDVGLDEMVGWQGVATHVDGDAFGANDGIVVIGGVDSTDGVTPRRVIVDDEGRLLTSAATSDGNLGWGNRNAVDTDALQLSTTSIPCNGVLVKAREDNVNDVWVGGATVTADTTEATGGWRLAPGASVGVPCRNVDDVYVRWAAYNAGDGVEWFASVEA